MVFFALVETALNVERMEVMRVEGQLEQTKNTLEKGRKSGPASEMKPFNLFKSNITISSLTRKRQETIVFYVVRNPGTYLQSSRMVQLKVGKEDPCECWTFPTV